MLARWNTAILTTLPLMLLVFLGIFSIAQPGKANAAYTDGANIIDNRVFLNANSMGISQIQSFLSSKGSGLASKSFVMQCSAAGSTANQLYSSVGAPCNQNVSSATIIYYAARIYGVNPQVILATIQKEQSLVTTGNPTVWQLTQAMGYDCPTTGSCDTSSSFFYQIDNGTWALRYHYERANRNNNWWSPSSSWVCGSEKNFYKPNLYPGQNVRFYDGNGVNYRTYFLANAATSAFYCYTPHAYNNPQGLYGRPAYGTTGQYYSGSYNFVTAFESWFGSRFVPNCIFPTASENSVYRLYNRGTGNHLLTKDPSEVCLATSIGWLYDGVLFTDDLTQNTPVYRLEREGRYLYTDSAVERDAAVNTHGFRLEGVALNGVNPASNPSEARAVYRLASYNGTYTYTISTYERDSFIRMGYRYEGVAFYLKENPGASVVPTYRLAHPNGAYLFTIHPSERDVAVSGYGYRYEGVGFNVITQLNTITVPIYRLAGSGGYLFTTSLAERANAINLGYRDEGIGMYTYGTMSDPGLNNIYRLARSGSYFYTQSYTEALVGRDYHSFRLEGLGFQTP